jgi:hypothetical protein
LPIGFVGGFPEVLGWGFVDWLSRSSSSAEKNNPPRRTKSAVAIFSNTVAIVFPSNTPSPQSEKSVIPNERIGTMHYGAGMAQARDLLFSSFRINTCERKELSIAK